MWLVAATLVSVGLIKASHTKQQHHLQGGLTYRRPGPSPQILSQQVRGAGPTVLISNDARSVTCTTRCPSPLFSIAF